MNFLGTFGQQFRQVWEGMSPRRRAFMVGVLVIGVSVVLGIGYYASRSDYQVLFSGLAPEDSASITSKLQANSVPYRLEAAGTTILVPAEKVQQARIEMAAEGLPAKGGGPGFEIFNSSPLGMSPFNQQVNYQRALQSELARTIMQIDPITYARVHVVRPEPTPFIREQKPTTASIVVRLKPGTSLNRNVAAGIVSLVARSVEGLTRENVTIVDTHGKLLSEEQNPETGPIASQLDYRRELENYLSSQAEKMLAKVVGAGRAVVRVTAELNYRSQKEKKETIDPERKGVLSEKITTSKASGDKKQKGAPGMGGILDKGGNGNSASTQETIQNEYVFSKITQESENRIGSVERLTVAALIDLSSTGKDGKALDVKQVEEIVKQAVGFKDGRDEIKVSDVPLKTPEEVIPPEEPSGGGDQVWQNLLSLVRYVSLGLAALAALSIGWMVFKSRRSRLESAAAAMAKTEADAAPGAGKLVLDDPEVLVQLLEKWLAGSKPGETPKRAAA